jgi:hypothetical protein
MDRKFDQPEFAADPLRLRGTGDSIDEMSRLLDPFQFVLIAVAGWTNRPSVVNIRARRIHSLALGCGTAAKRRLTSM